MFNVKKFLTFCARVMLVAVSLLGTLLILSVLTELRAYRVGLKAASSWVFWLFVLLNTLPSLVAAALACWLAAYFVRSLYGLESTKEGFGFLEAMSFFMPIGHLES